MKKAIMTNVITKKSFVYAAIACLSLVLMTLTSCDAYDFSNEYADFTKADTKYKLFLELNTGSLCNHEGPELKKTCYKYHQNEYKDISEIDKVLEDVKQAVKETRGSTTKRDFSVRYVIRDRCGNMIKCSTYDPYSY